MSAIYFVRHAHADWTPDENRPLSQQGGEDAARVANLLGKYPIRAIYSSPFRRAIQTVEPLAEQLGLSIQMESDLRERRLGDQAFEDFCKAVEVTWQNPSFAHPGGESSLTAQRRGISVVRRLAEQHPQEEIVLSTHGNLLALILQEYIPTVNFTFWRSMSMPDVYELDLAGKMPILRRIWKEHSYP